MSRNVALQLQNTISALCAYVKILARMVCLGTLRRPENPCTDSERTPSRVHIKSRHRHPFLFLTSDHWRTPLVAPLALNPDQIRRDLQCGRNQSHESNTSLDP